MDIILTYGKEKIQLPASMIYMPSYNQNLEVFLKGLKYDVDLLKFSTYNAQAIDDKLTELRNYIDSKT